MCIYIHPCLSLPKQREVTGVVHIGVGFLRCSFLMIWHCEGLETRNGRRWDSHASFIYSRRYYNNPFLQRESGGRTLAEWHDSCGTTYRTHASRTRTYCYLVRQSAMLHTSQRLQDLPEREYRHPPALAHLLHPQPRLLPRFIRQHQYGQLLRCIQIGYNFVSFLELCFHPVVYSFRIPLQAY